MENEVNSGLKEENPKLKRIDFNYIADEVLNVIKINKGFLRTVVGMIVKPEKTVHEYLFTDRKRITKPLIYLIVCVGAFLLLAKTVHIDYRFLLIGDDIPENVSGWLNRNLTYTSLVIIIFLAFWIQVLFKKKKFNYFEIIVSLCYVFGTAFLIFTFLSAIYYLLHKAGFRFNPSIVIFSVFGLYIFFSIADIFKGEIFISYLKSLFTMLLTYVSYALFLELLYFMAGLF